MNKQLKHRIVVLAGLAVFTLATAESCSTGGGSCPSGMHQYTAANSGNVMCINDNNDVAPVSYSSQSNPVSNIAACYDASGMMTSCVYAEVK
jgi:hypothetical protein